MMAALSLGRFARPAEAAGGSKEALESIDQILRQAVQEKAVPGVVAMAATDDGVLYQGAFGSRNLANGANMTLDSVFWLASMTKAITSTAALQLVEQGKLNLDQPIGGILADLAQPHVLEGFDEAGRPKLRAAKRPITIRHLLTHTAGFTYDLFNANTARYEKYAQLPSLGSGKNAALQTPLAFDPGDRWEYGINTDYVGKAVEAVSHKRLDAYMHDHILGPLGMTDTGFAPSPDQQARLVSIHRRAPDGSLAPEEFPRVKDPEFYSGGGGLYSTAHDYLTFLQMIMHRGKANGVQILRPESVALMSENQIGNLNLPKLWKTSAPKLSNDVDFSAGFPDQDLKWSLSFMINTRPGAAGASTGSLFWAGLANTFYWLDPARRVSGVFLTQILPGSDQLAGRTYGQFASGVYKALGNA
jgi:CubicO group peptidase (beta-lactamase class C family)